MQLGNILKVPVLYFFEDYPEYSGSVKDNTGEEDLNYSFLAKLFSTLSDKQKEKILTWSLIAKLILRFKVTLKPSKEF